MNENYTNLCFYLTGGDGGVNGGNGIGHDGGFGGGNHGGNALGGEYGVPSQEYGSPSY